ncbi:uncharacterized protein LOC131657968 [Vicia villosa]|uniref:uncharacterized protein LOC131657968 n=1 Tax=Vicia villosa TaxID=3911 RepID=UPI00273B00F7|nr:uncharacterized protein LOC131657968 [Vicia villosa]
MWGEIWRAIEDLGVVNLEGKRDYRKHIEVLEKVDKNIGLVGKEKENISYSFSNANGQLGGLIIPWKEGGVEVVHSFKEEGFLGVKLIWRSYVYYIVNVYSSCDLNKKKELWNALLLRKNNYVDGEWVIGGDFNSIKNHSERKGRTDRERSEDSKAFVNFIIDSKLLDIPCKGKSFTWDISDQCPIWLIKDGVNWGPKPFKVNNEWFSNSSFLPFVEKKWREIKVEGRGDFVLKEKLCVLKDCLKWWNTAIFGKFDLDVENNVHGLNEGDCALERASEGERIEMLANRNETTSRFWLNLRIKENMLVQKSRLKWLNGGE